MGLLNYITSHSLDEDYAHVHQQREQSGGAQARGPGRSALVVMALFGVLVATAGVQTARNAGTDELSHDSLVAQVNQGRAVLEETRSTLTALESDLIGARQANNVAARRQQSQAQLARRLGTGLGTVAVTGQGVRMVVDDAEGATTEQQLVLDSDLRDIVNGLWEAGAEAISVNGQRLTTTSAIRLAGSLITVNYVSVAPPYTILAIGDPNRLPARFVESTTGTYWLNNEETFGLKFEMTTSESLTLPAADARRFRLASAKTKADEAEGVS